MVYVIRGFTSPFGPPDMAVISLPMGGAVAAALWLGAAVVVSAVFRVVELSDIWFSNRRYALAVLVASCAVLLFGRHLGFLSMTTMYPHPEFPTEPLSEELRLWIIALCYNGISFALFNYPWHSDNPTLHPSKLKP